MAEPKHFTASNGKAFIVGFIPAMAVPKAAKQLLEVGGPVIGEVLKLVKDKATASADVKQAFVEGKLTSVITQAMSVDDDKLLALMLKMAEASSVIGVEGNLRKHFDAAFTGSPKSMVEWFVEAVKVNFADFFSDSETKTG